MSVEVPLVWIVLLLVGYALIGLSWCIRRFLLFCEQRRLDLETEETRRRIRAKFDEIAKGY